ncbi:hypothetical protein Tco_0592827, partial [Tanacetum coccineum]
GLSHGRTEEQILAALKDVHDFDAYSEKKLYPIYDKLFKVEYPFIVKISNGYGHSVADRLKVHPDPAPFGGMPAPTISTAFADLILLLHGKKA